jgi:hypothetical protein
MTLGVLKAAVGSNCGFLFPGYPPLSALMIFGRTCLHPVPNLFELGRPKKPYWLRGCFLTHAEENIMNIAPQLPINYIQDILGLMKTLSFAGQTLDVDRCCMVSKVTIGTQCTKPSLLTESPILHCA